MTTATDDMAPNRAVSEENAIKGAVVHYKWPEIVLAEFEQWFDDGVHVFRAVDFDVIAMHEDVGCAFDQFVSEIHALCFALFDLEREGAITEGEVELLVKLAEPLVELHRREVDEAKRRERRLIEISFPRLRRRGHHSPRDWSRRSSQEKSAAPSIA